MLDIRHKLLSAALLLAAIPGLIPAAAVAQTAKPAAPAAAASAAPLDINTA